MTYEVAKRRHLAGAIAIDVRAMLTATAMTNSAASSGSSGSGLLKGNLEIGAILSLSGPYAEYGKSIQGELEAAVVQINGHGGLDGHKITLSLSKTTKGIRAQPCDVPSSSSGTRSRELLIPVFQTSRH
jgi:hypothetical protein